MAHNFANACKQEASLLVLITLSSVCGGINGFPDMIEQSTHSLLEVHFSQKAVTVVHISISHRVMCLNDPFDKSLASPM